MLSISEVLNGSREKMKQLAFNGDDKALHILLTSNPHLAKTGTAIKALGTAVKYRHFTVINEFLKANPALVKINEVQSAFRSDLIGDPIGVSRFLNIEPDLSKSVIAINGFIFALKNSYMAEYAKIASLLLKANPDIAKSDEVKKAFWETLREEDLSAFSDFLKVIPELAKTIEARNAYIIAVKKEKSKVAFHFLMANPELAKIEETQLSTLKLVLTHISPLERFDEEREAILVKILNNGKNQLHYYLSEMLSNNVEEQTELKKKIQELEINVCNNQYTTLNYNKWLYDLTKKLSYKHNNYHPDTKLKLPLKDLFPLIEGIAKIHSSELKNILSGELIKLVENSHMFETWKDLSSINIHSSPMAMLLLNFHKPYEDAILKSHTQSKLQNSKDSIHRYTIAKFGDVSDKELDKKFFGFINSKRIRGDGIAQTQLLTSMLKLNDIYRYESRDLSRDLFINVVLESESIREFLKNMKNLELMLNIFPEKVSKEWLSKEALGNIEETISKNLASILELPANTKGDVFAFYKTFRQPEALLKYMSRIKYYLETKKSFVDFIIDNLAGTFYENRYNIDCNAHLNKVFANRPNLLREWMNGQKIQKTSTKGKKEKQYSVEDTDNPQDLFLIGTEIDGSCQHVHADPAYNKCLMAYVKDGKDRALIIRDNETGKIQFRSIMRILWDVEEEHPVLTLEKPYTTSSCPNESQEWIKELALQRAKKLQLPLVSEYYIDKQTSNEFPKYPNNVKSYGSLAPYEYLEKKGITTGSFTLSAGNYFILYNPTQKPFNDIPVSLENIEDNKIPATTEHIIINKVCTRKSFGFQ